MWYAWAFPHGHECKYSRIYTPCEEKFACKYPESHRIVYFQYPLMCVHPCDLQDQKEENNFAWPYYCFNIRGTFIFVLCMYVLFRKNYWRHSEKALEKTMWTPPTATLMNWRGLFRTLSGWKYYCNMMVHCASLRTSDLLQWWRLLFRRV